MSYSSQGSTLFPLTLLLFISAFSNADTILPGAKTTGSNSGKGFQDHVHEKPMDFQPISHVFVLAPPLWHQRQTENIHMPQVYGEVVSTLNGMEIAIADYASNYAPSGHLHLRRAHHPHPHPHHAHEDDEGNHELLIWVFFRRSSVASAQTASECWMELFIPQGSTKVHMDLGPHDGSIVDRVMGSPIDVFSSLLQENTDWQIPNLNH